jgi:hypothetical protein
VKPTIKQAPAFKLYRVEPGRTVIWNKQWQAAEYIQVLTEVGKAKPVKPGVELPDLKLWRKRRRK